MSPIDKDWLRWTVSQDVASYLLYWTYTLWDNLPVASKMVSVSEQ